VALNVASRLVACNGPHYAKRTGIHAKIGIKHSSTNRTHVRCAHVRPTYLAIHILATAPHPSNIPHIDFASRCTLGSPSFISPIRPGDCMSSSSNRGKLRKSPPPQPQPRFRLPSIHWLFRSNIPRRRTSYITPDVRKRNFFGMGEILGVIANVCCSSTPSYEHFAKYFIQQPSETVRSLTESKKLLEEARTEMKESRERSQLRTKHTFSRLPGFFPRKAEMLAIERAMEGEPSFTILFGASSVGKASLSFEYCDSGGLTEHCNTRPPFFEKFFVERNITFFTLTSGLRDLQILRVCTIASANRWNNILRKFLSSWKAMRNLKKRLGVSRSV